MLYFVSLIFLVGFVICANTLKKPDSEVMFIQMMMMLLMFGGFITILIAAISHTVHGA